MALREQIRILVVDDTATSRGLIMDALSGFGIRQVRSANAASDALADLALYPAHLVISDMNMPGMDGLALLSALREGARTARIGFLLITGRVTAEVLAEGKRLGMNNYMAKPFEPKDLLRAVEAVVGRL